MTIRTVRFTSRELELLTSLATDQLFRREFIDPKMPGSSPNYPEIAMGKALVARLGLILNPGCASRTLPVKRRQQ
jgi:hypothetical protein